MSTRRALAFSFLDRYSSHLITFASVIVLSRLLTPREIGLFAVTMVVIGVLSSFRDLGAGQYLVQAEALDVERIRSVWAVQLGLGWLLALLVLAASVPVAAFVDEPAIRDIMRVLALNFALTPFGSITYAALSRELRFGRLAAMRFTGSVVNAAVAIGLAWAGIGAISLAWGNVASALAVALVATALRPPGLPWRPSLRGTRSVVSFGSRVTLFGMLTSLTVDVPNFLLGKLQGATSAGFYSRGNGLLTLFWRGVMEAVTSVTLPAFAKLDREGGDLPGAFLRAFAYVTVLGWTFMLGALLLADPLVRLLYGDQWLESIVVVRILALSYAVGIPIYLSSNLLISLGEVGRVFRVGLLTFLATLALVAWAARHGLVAVAWSILPVACFNLVLWTRETLACLPLPHGELAGRLGRSALVAVVANLPAAAAVVLFGTSPADLLAPLLLGIGGGLLAFPLALRLVRHPLYEEVPVLLEKLRPARRPA